MDDAQHFEEGALVGVVGVLLDDVDEVLQAGAVPDDGPAIRGGAAAAVEVDDDADVEVDAAQVAQQAKAVVEAQGPEDEGGLQRDGGVGDAVDL